MDTSKREGECVMATFTIDYYERVNNYWCREIEADSLDQAQDIFLKEIQGEEPDSVDVIDAIFEDKVSA